MAVVPDVNEMLSCDVSISDRVYMDIPDHPTSCEDRFGCRESEDQRCFFPRSSLSGQSSDFPHFGSLPAISVILTCHGDDAQFVTGALASVANQMFKNWECIVVDDGSPERQCFTAVQQFIDRQRLRGVKNFYKKNGWIADARNFGIERASGTYIIPIDADDYMYPNFLQNVAEALIRDDKIELLYADQMFFGVEASEPLWHLWEHLTIDNAINRGPLPVTTVFTRKLWQMVGGYKRDMIFGNEDYSFWISLLKLRPKTQKVTGFSSWYRIKSGAMHLSSDYRRMGLAMLHTHHPDMYNYAEIREDFATIFCNLKKAHENSLTDAVGSQPESCPGWIYLSLLQLGMDVPRKHVLHTLTDGARKCDQAFSRKWFSVLSLWLEEGPEAERISLLDSREKCAKTQSCGLCRKLFKKHIF